MDLGHSSVYENVVWNEIITIAAKQEYRQWWIMSVKWIRQPLLRFIPSTKSVIGKKSENNVRKTPDDSGVFLSLSKIPFGAFRQFFAVCCAHSLCAVGAQLVHSQPEKYFVSGTRPDIKCLRLYFSLTRKILRSFFNSLRKTPDDSGVFLFYPQ